MGRPPRRTAQHLQRDDVSSRHERSTTQSATLPLEIDGYDLEPLEQRGRARVHAPAHGRRAARRRRGGPRRGGRLRPGDPAATSRRGASELPFAGDAHARLVLAAAVRADRVPPLGARVGGARPRAAPGRPRRSARRSGASRSRCASSSRRASRTSRAGSSSIPSCASSSIPTRDWTDEHDRALAASGSVDTVDFKGIYRGDFGIPPDPELYRRIAEAFPDAWIEDPALTPETVDACSSAHRDRITWDAGDPRVERRRGTAVPRRAA